MVKDKSKLKKKWFPVLAPKIFNESLVGESYLYDPNDAVGRITSANLMNVTGDVKSQNITVKFMISEIKENQLHTVVKSYEIGSSSIKRIVRRKHNKLDDSLIVQTKDEKKVRIKPLVLTRNKVKSSVKMALRKMVREEITKLSAELTFEDLFNSVVTKRLQKSIRDKINKIYPVKICEIRVLKEAD